MSNTSSVRRSGRSPQQRLRRGREVRDVNLQLAVACGAAVLLAACLLIQPDPRGLGTHSRLGMPTCSYLARSGIPCPSCGATTSLCWFVRGKFRRSFSVHPMGFVAGTLLVASILFSVVSAMLRRRWLVHLRKVPASGWVALACMFLGLFLLGWPQRVERYLKARAAEGAPAFATAGRESPRPQSDQESRINRHAPASRAAARLAGR